MQEIINYFVDEKGTTQAVAKVLSKSIVKYDDIRDEFLTWLKARNYEFKNPLVIDGYCAKTISEAQPRLDAAGVYGFMVTLRDNPQKAQELLSDGFKIK